MMKSNKRLSAIINHNTLNLKCDLSVQNELPIIKSIDYVPKRLISFNEVLTSKDYDAGVHFFIDDYQFERLWNNPKKYIDKLRKFDVILTPDFSVYSGMSKMSQLWNTYRNRFIGAYLQNLEIKVIPTISWSENLDYSFYFESIEPNGTIAISTNGVFIGEKKEVYLKGIERLIDKLKPQNILIYGFEIPFDSKGSNVIYYNNKHIERIRKHKYTLKELDSKKKFFIDYCEMFDDYDGKVLFMNNEIIFTKANEELCVNDWSGECLLSYDLSSGHTYKDISSELIGDKTLDELISEYNYDIPMIDKTSLQRNPTMIKTSKEYFKSESYKEYYGR